MRLYLAHHGDAVGPDVDPRRPLSLLGRDAVERLAAAAAKRGVQPATFWHSGKLRAKQTAEAYWRVCNALATFSATRDLQPEDPPEWMRDRLVGETEDLLIAGHFPHLPRLLNVLLGGGADTSFPQHGLVALTRDENGTWREDWRLS